MENLFHVITDYLNKEAINRKDIISVLSLFVFWIMKDILIEIKDILVKLISKSISFTFKKFKTLNRKYIKQKPNINEIIEIEERLLNGGKLKWYEKRLYDKCLEQFKTISEKYKGMEIDTKTSLYSVLDTMEQSKYMIKKK